MMKRILLIVSLGVSFVAPAAFGSTRTRAEHEAKVQAAMGNPQPGLRGYTAPCKAETGQASGCVESQLLAANAGWCDRQKELKSWQQDNINHGFTASGARIAKP